MFYTLQYKKRLNLISTFDEKFVPQIQDLNLMSPQQCHLEPSIFCNSFSLHDQVPVSLFHWDPWYPMWMDCSVLEPEHLTGKHKPLHPTCV